MEDYDMVENVDDDLDFEEDALQLIPSNKREDELFLPQNAEKEPEVFWATRG